MRRVTTTRSRKKLSASAQSGSGSNTPSTTNSRRRARNDNVSSSLRSSDSISLHSLSNSLTNTVNSLHSNPEITEEMLTRALKNSSTHTMGDLSSNTHTALLQSSSSPTTQQTREDFWGSHGRFQSNRTEKTANLGTDLNASLPDITLMEDRTSWAAAAEEEDRDGRLKDPSSSQSNRRHFAQGMRATSSAKDELVDGINPNIRSRATGDASPGSGANHHHHHHHHLSNAASADVCSNNRGEKAASHTKSARNSSPYHPDANNFHYNNARHGSSDNPLKQHIHNFRQVCGCIVNNAYVQLCIIVLIIVNALFMGLGTFDFVTEQKHVDDAFEAVDQTFLVIFTVEIMMQFIYHGRKLLKDGWLVFDLIIVISSWSMKSFQVIRAFRIFRAFRLVTRLTILRNLVEAIFAVAPSMGAITALLLLIFYIYAVMCTVLFKDLNERGITSIDYFGSLNKTLFTLFTMMTLEWAEIVREVMEEYYWAWAVFSTFLVVTSFILYSLVIAVVCDAVKVTEHHDENMDAEDEKEESLRRMDDLQQAVYDMRILQQSMLLSLLGVLEMMEKETSEPTSRRLVKEDEIQMQRQYERQCQVDSEDNGSVNSYKRATDDTSIDSRTTPPTPPLPDMPHAIRQDAVTYNDTDNSNIRKEHDMFWEGSLGKKKHPSKDDALEDCPTDHAVVSASSLMYGREGSNFSEGFESCHSTEEFE